MGTHEGVGTARPCLYEEPLPMDEHEVLSSVASSTCIPVSAGRWACSLLEFQELLQRRSVGLLQPASRLTLARRVLPSRRPSWVPAVRKQAHLVPRIRIHQPNFSTTSPIWRIWP